MKAAIYARFSTHLQRDSSIEDQVRVCTERAEREGWQVSGVFSDYAISGAVRDRPGLNSLLAHIETGGAEIVLAEAIDRLSRDLEDMAAIYKRLVFRGARIVTLSEGEIDELKIGFKGTMASQYRKDTADKIRRGQSGRVAAGRVPGNVVYGYRKVHALDARGEPERGLREIDPEQAGIVRRIYREYLAGESPLAIARRLNAEGVPSPSGGQWSVSAINGDNVRGNGILCNPIYTGELVYNRTTMMRDPVTRRRLPRANPPDQWQRQPVPELRIVDQQSWDAVRARKEDWKGWSYASQKRPKRLLSELVKCGLCGSNMVIDGGGRLACSSARTRGTCSNHRTALAEMVERRVVSGLERDLLHPDRIRLAFRTYTADRARLDREALAATARRRKRAGELDRQIARLVDAISAGAGDIPEIVEKLRLSRQERESLDLAADEESAGQVIMLHPNFAAAYERAVKEITALLAGDSADAREARNAIRAMVDRVVLTPKDDRPGMHIEIEGRLSAMLELANGGKPHARNCTVSVVAEEGLEPPTRGL